MDDVSRVADLGEIELMIAHLGQAIDARSASRFNATTPEPRPGLRSGHTPGAGNMPFTNLVQKRRLLPPSQLRAASINHGNDLDRPTTTRDSGLTAAVLALALEIAGAKQFSLDDSSWADDVIKPNAAISVNAIQPVVA